MLSEDYVPDPVGAYVLRARCPRSMTGHLTSDNYVPVSTEACTLSKKYKIRIHMVIDGVLEIFDDIALDCKDFQPDDIYTCVLGHEIVDVHGKDVPSSMYCKDEKSDHKLGIYCNLIGPLYQS